MLRNIRTILAAAALLVPLCLHAQSIPKLKQAEEISSGVFENGIEYYFVSNDVQTGRADFALIQSGRPDVADSRFVLRNLEHMDPDAFLERTGVPYTEDGFVSYYQNARVFHFPDVNVRDRMTADSTMLMMLDLMHLSDRSQTIVVCGDIDREAYKTLFRTLGLTIPKLTPQEYSTDGEKEPSVVRNASGPGVISLSFKIGTASREQAGTPVPLVSELFARELGAILSGRVRRDFEQAGIPCYLNVSDDKFEVHVPEDRIGEAKTLVRAILGDIKDGGVTTEEFARAKKVSLPDIISTGLKKGKSNRFYVNRVVSAVLTGSNLASEETIKNFFSKRKISDKRELGLFNNFVTALLGAHVEQDPEYTRMKMVYPDMNSVLKTSKIKKEKISNTTVDPVTGGSLWTWSNGMKVLYKYDKNADGFSYGIALRGDATNVEGIAEGESAFLSDLLRISRIGGIGGEEFHQMLRVEGIAMDEDISIRGMRITGHAPVSQAENVMKALLKLAYSREMDKAAIDYYIQCRKLRDESELPSVKSVMDSLMCPDFKFLRYSSIASMGDDLPERAEAYFQKSFDNMSDGLMIIIGSIPEAKATEVLSEYLGGFSTSHHYAIRNKVPYELNSGRSTYSTTGEDESVNIAATAIVPVTLDNYLMFQIAMEAMRRQFSKEIARMGMYAEVSGAFEIRPKERFTVYVTCRPCMEDGLPEGVSSTASSSALKRVREEFSRMRFVRVSEAELKSYKAVVQGKMAAELASPDGMMKYALLRYSEGKDLSTGYADRLKGIVIDDIRWILDELSSSGIVEYVVE